MARKSTSKRRKAARENDGGVIATTPIDMISSLPDSVLCHIMSFLPTKTSVATMSLVSRRWRHLWENLQVFDFSDDSHEDDHYPIFFTRFAFFVNAVLSLRRSRHIRKFHLSSGMLEYDKFRSDCFDLWVRAAINPQLEELSLRIAYCFDDQRVLLPSSLLNCTNLVSLSLVGAIDLKFQHSSVHFPSLKMLKLDLGIVDGINIVKFGTELVDRLAYFLSGCPILETLDILFDASFLTQVPVPSSSKRLKLTNSNFSWTYLEIESDWPDVKFGGIVTKTKLGIIGNLQTMEAAYLDIFSLLENELVDPILNLIRDQYHDIHLLLRHSTTKWPLCTPIPNYPEFCNLHHLKFILPCFNTNLLLNVLEKCHNLRVLIIQSNKEEPSPIRTWEPKSTTAPKCLRSHLTYIHIEGYQGWEDELTFAEYVLQNGLVLQTVLIFVDNSMDLTKKYRSLKRLSDIPRGSVTCKLKFDAAVSP
ncbi:FBD-associated F-box protein [Trifolium repens]|nr:FBD-associated F-box protein [Trifolium repens]